MHKMSKYVPPFIAISVSDLDMWLMNVGVMRDVLDVVGTMMWMIVRLKKTILRVLNVEE